MSDKPIIHDHIDGDDDRCVECKGECQLTGVDLHYTRLLSGIFRFLADHKLLDKCGGLDFRMSGAGVDVEAFKKRASAREEKKEMYYLARDVAEEHNPIEIRIDRMVGYNIVELIQSAAEEDYGTSMKEFCEKLIAALSTGDEPGRERYPAIERLLRSGFHPEKDLW